MKIGTKRIIVILTLIFSIIWNGLCAFKVLPIELFVVSVGVIAGCSFVIIIMPLFFPFCKRIGESSNYIHDLTGQEKQLCWMTLCLVFAWLFTSIICTVLRAK